MAQQGGLSIKVVGLDKLIPKLDGSKLMGPPVRAAMQKSVLYVEGEARRGAKPHPVDTGELARSIKSSVAQTGIPLHGRVFTEKIYAAPAEFGRRPGRMPPVAPIEAWARRHGIDIPGYVLARAIGRRGTKGLFYMKAAAAAGAKKIPEFFKQAAKDIEATWGKK